MPIFPIGLAVRESQNNSRSQVPTVLIVIALSPMSKFLAWVYVRARSKVIEKWDSKEPIVVICIGIFCVKLIGKIKNLSCGDLSSLEADEQLIGTHSARSQHGHWRPG